MRHLDLFSGIGGFSLAVDRAFHDQEIEHTFVEWEPFCQAVLKKHWPEAEIHGDIRAFIDDAKRNQQGGTHSRSMGKAEGISRFDRKKHSPAGWFSRADVYLLTGGFPCQPFSHAGRRKGTADDRYLWPEMFECVKIFQPTWVIAENVRGLASWNDGLVLETVCADLEREGYEVWPLVIPAASVGAPHRRDRVWIIANRAGERLEGSTRSELQRGSERFARNDAWHKDWREVAFATCHDGVDDGLSRWMDGVTISASRHRKERLKACGNAIVPQVAMQIMLAMKEVDDVL